MRRLLLSGLCGVVLAASSFASLAQEATKATDEQRRAVAELLATYAQAYNAADAAKVGALWMPDSQLVDIHGNKVDGREAIQKLHADIFAKNPAGKLSIKPFDIRPIGDNVLIVEVQPKVSPAAPGQPAEVRASLVLLNEKGKWLIASVRDTLRAAASSEPLKAIEWLIGDWTTTGNAPGKPSVTTSCQWTGNKSFLIRFYRNTRGDVAHRGTEIIGYDAKQKAIRSWAFDSDGGFFERKWKSEDGRWVIESSGVLPDGRTVDATDVLTRQGDDKVSFRSENIRVDGQKQPDIAAIELARRAEGEAEATTTPAASILPKQKK